MLFKTEIVRAFHVKKIYSITLVALYFPAFYYLFLNNSEHKNGLLILICVVIYLVATTFLVAFSFVKPKKLGNLELSRTQVAFNIQGVLNTLGVSELENLSLNYLDYGSWSSHSLYGNKNKLTITTTAGATYNFEILIKNKEAKDQLKQLLNSEELIEKTAVIVNDRSKFGF